MAKQTDVFQLRGERDKGYQFTPTDTTNAAIIAAAGSDDSIVESIDITSTDTADRKLQIIMNDGTTDHIEDTVDVPAGSGTDGVHAAVDGLTNPLFPINSAGKKIYRLAAGCTLKAAMTTTITAGKIVDVSAEFEDF